MELPNPSKVIHCPLVGAPVGVDELGTLVGRDAGRSLGLLYGRELERLDGRMLGIVLGLADD